MNVSGNTMTMAHFHDFYFLEAMRAGLSMAKSAKPDFQFRHSVERLEADIESAFNTLTHQMAMRIYVYLYAAALGEARHADAMCETHITELRNSARDAVYEKSIRYFPSDENVEILRGMFTQKWLSSGFGGKNWLDIVEGMMLYGKISDAAFIDHAVDLEHNNGSVFTKSAYNVKVQCFGSYDANNLRTFLNIKFAHDILNWNDTMWNGKYSYRWDVSSKVYRLLSRYSNIVEPIHAVDFCVPELEWLEGYEVEWEYNTFTVTDSRKSISWQHCDLCNARIDGNDHEHVNSNCVCRRCYAKYDDTCDHCNKQARSRSLVYVADKRENFCQSCVSTFTETCNECKRVVYHYITTDDDNSFLCADCQVGHFCDDCGEFYSDIESHNKEEHAPENDCIVQLPLWTDGDGVLDVVDNEGELVYHKTSFYVATDEENKKPYNENAYEIIGSGFIIHKKELSNGRLVKSKKWHVGLKVSGILVTSNYDFDLAVQKVKNIKDLIDWNEIKSLKDFQALDKSLRDTIIYNIKL